MPSRKLSGLIALVAGLVSAIAGAITLRSGSGPNEAPGGSGGRQGRRR